MEFSNEKLHGKTVCWEPHVQFSPVKISLTSSRRRIRSEVTFITLAYYYREQLVDMVVYVLKIVLLYLFLLIHQQMTSQFLLGIGTSKIILGTLLGYPDGVLMNGRGPFGAFFAVNPGSTYRLRISNVGSALTLNFKIEGHQLLLVETEGSYTEQTLYDSIDVHVGQSYSVLITTDQAPGDFYIVANSRFGSPSLTGVGILHYTNSPAPASGPLPQGPENRDVNFSINQARSIRQNLTTGAARPNPQGSFHYGMINVSRTLIFQNSAPIISGLQRFAVNDISYINPDTPLKLADYFNISGVFSLNSIPDFPSGRTPTLGTSVLSGDFRSFLEVIFQNFEDTLQSWHIDGYNAFVVGYGPNTWNSTSRLSYNEVDAVARATIQVYPQFWTAVMLELDNVGMWNIRSQILQRQYLGQEFYMRVFNPETSTRTESPIPNNAILCGKAAQG
ncbi:hypothetical protein O6H91_09G059300 [Diphasiastrum complanatum]|uniref:Uncharacterized protein n=1 Tax=Diphasiastrum complanatum TaxID=34168 RepID=A0ACC2CPU7_DIPCM|nr:hypothetical protein O6H91_09G059300 [Diphasiastrum complanatum]